MPNATITETAPTTVANYRLYGQTWSNTFISMGLVKTADAGQVNWSTVADIPPTNSTRDYEVWRFADAAQATAPIFIKTTYSGSTSARHIGFQCGNGSDGNGNILNPVVADLNTTYRMPTDNATSNTFFISSDGSGLAIFNTSSPSLIIVDRQRDTAGAALPTGWMIARRSVAGTPSLHVFDSTSQTGPGPRIHFANEWPAIPNLAVTSNSTFVNDIGETVMLPTWISNRQGTFNSKMVISYPKLDILATQNFSVQFMGASRTYKPAPNTLTGVDCRNSDIYCPAIWWSD